jgi:hypothetical protein
MNAPRPVGLGIPDVEGKRSLFLPPTPEPKPSSKAIQVKKNIAHPTPKPSKEKVERIRTTTELTPSALTILQKIQQQYRLKTGKVLPLWKVLSEAIEYYGSVKGFD